MVAKPEPGGTPDTEPGPPRVRVASGRDVFGNPTGFLEVDAAAAGQWDETCWSDRPPS
jgi:hypothetical protein